MKKFFSRKKDKKIDLAPKAPEPRQMVDIEQDYGKLVAQAGQAQYQVYVYTEDLKRINDALRSLNYEAAARKSAEPTPKEEPTNEV